MNRWIISALTLLLVLLIGPGQLLFAQKIDDSSLKSQIKDFSKIIKSSGIVTRGNERCLDTCDDQQFIKARASSKDTDKEAKLFSKENNQQIKLSVISKKRLHEIFKTLSNDEDNSFNFPMDGCFARAHRMAQVMDEMGVISGKAFLEGHLIAETKYGENAQWGYHVASVVLVEENGKQVPYIIDPAILDRPVTHQEWKNKMLTIKGSKLEKEYFTTRFAYDTRAINDELDGYRDDEVQDAHEAIKNFRRLGDMIDLIDSKETAKK